MLRVQLICVGKLKEAYWRDACAEYARRLSPLCRFTIVELPEARLPENPSDGEIRRALEQEGEKILEAAGNAVLFPLCIEGGQVDSPGLAQLLEETAVAGTGNIAFVIGSSFGLSPEVKAKGRKRLSMSKMTFPHQLARVMLCEQIYRAFQILRNTRYHK